MDKQTAAARELNTLWQNATEPSSHAANTASNTDNTVTEPSTATRTSSQSTSMLSKGLQEPPSPRFQPSDTSFYEPSQTPNENLFILPCADADGELFGTSKKSHPLYLRAASQCAITPDFSRSICSNLSVDARLSYVHQRYTVSEWQPQVHLLLFRSNRRQ